MSFTSTFPHRIHPGGPSSCAPRQAFQCSFQAPAYDHHVHNDGRPCHPDGGFCPVLHGGVLASGVEWVPMGGEKPGRTLVPARPPNGTATIKCGGTTRGAGRRTAQELAPHKPRILVCAHSNAAADELLQRVMDVGFCDGRGRIYRPDVVRIGSDDAPMLPRARAVWVDALVRWVARTWLSPSVPFRTGSAFVCARAHTHTCTCRRTRTHAHSHAHVHRCARIHIYTNTLTRAQRRCRG